MKATAAVIALKQRSELIWVGALLLLFVPLFVPMPALGVDLGMALSIGLAVSLFIASLAGRTPDGLTGFPTWLLVSAVVRLVVALSCSRLILTQGEAGGLVTTFGRSFLDGNHLAGLALVGLLALVQLLVIGKGTERIAEVAARFALDALPGKQMAIDADLRSGAVDATEAQLRRDRLARESALAGAMDGTIKFIKGEATAHLVMLLVNGTAGMILGAMGGLEVGASARLYLALAVGAGLGGQTTLLMVSLAAGMTVTRMSQRDSGGLAAELGGPFRAVPAALWVAGGALALIGCLPGVPLLPFGGVGLACIAGAQLNRRIHSPDPLPARASTARPMIEVDLAPELVTALGGEEALLEVGRRLRAGLWDTLGLLEVPPAVRSSAAVTGWSMAIDGTPAAWGSVRAGQLLTQCQAETAALLGIEAESAIHPITGEPICFIKLADRPAMAHTAEVLGPVETLACVMLGSLLPHAERLIGLEEVEGMLTDLEATHSLLALEARKLLEPRRMVPLFRALVREGVALRPACTLVNAIVQEAPQTPDPLALAEKVRRAMGRHTLHRFHGHPGVPLPVLLLGPEVDQALRDGDLGPEREKRLIQAILKEIGRPEAGAAVLAPGQVRPLLATILRRALPRVRVLAYEELPPEQSLRPMALLDFGRPDGDASAAAP